MTFAALRYFNAAGATPDQGLGYQRADATHLIPLAMLGMVGKRPPLTIMGTDYPSPDGTAVRDYLHVADLADAHVLALTQLMQGAAPMTLNLGTSQGASVREVVEGIARVTGVQVPHTLGPRRAGDPPKLVADASRAMWQLGWTPTRSTLENIIRDDWAWHRSQL